MAYGSYTSRDVAELFGIPVTQVRAMARSGFLSPSRAPGNRYRFSFQDLVLLRTARGLAAARVPVRRVRRALRRLKNQLPRGRALTELRITAQGDRVVVRDGDTSWNPESGQVVLDFSVADLATRVAPLAREAARSAQQSQKGLSAPEWYEIGLDLEPVAPADAMDAYLRALQLDPRHTNTHVNLGRLLQEAGQVAEAVTHYQAVLRLDPKHATAAFNLGIALEDLNRAEEAIEAYQRALVADPGFADAHFNLARLFEKAGKRTAAFRHLKSYKMLNDAR